MKSVDGTEYKSIEEKNKGPQLGTKEAEKDIPMLQTDDTEGKHLAEMSKAQ